MKASIKDFLNLKPGFAGDILQDFFNYGVKLAIIGDFSKYRSKSLQDFIRERNKGNMIFFPRQPGISFNKIKK